MSVESVAIIKKKKNIYTQRKITLNYFEKKDAQVIVNFVNIATPLILLLWYCVGTFTKYYTQ